MTPLQRFGALWAQPDGHVPLDRAVLLAAAHVRGHADIVGALAALDALAMGCAEPTRDRLIGHLCGELGFHGGPGEYEDPESSFLDAVVERRRGLPILLSIIAIEVGRRLGLHLSGVGAPGHFVVHDDDDPGVLIDVFAGGTTARLPAGVNPFPVTNAAVVGRVLANLKVLYARRRQRDPLVRVLELRTRVPGVGAEERDELARLLAVYN